MRETRRERQHAQVVEEIKDIARQQMAVHGAASLSLGAIARAMGFTTPALYRYFDNRDALVTALIIDAYEDLGRGTAAAVESTSSEDIDTRFLAIVYAYRRWALAHPQDYVLVHGAVFPGYVPPMDRIAMAALGTLAHFVTLLQDAQRLDRLKIPSAYHQVNPAIRDGLHGLHVGAADQGLPPALVTLSFLIWLPIHGLVWQEIAGHLPAAVFGDGRLFELQTQVLGESLGLLSTPA